MLDSGHFPAALELKAGQESGVTIPERIAEVKNEIVDLRQMIEAEPDMETRNQAPT